MAARYAPPEALSPPQPYEVSQGITLVSPLSRKGVGPGLIVVVSRAAAGLSIVNGIPSPSMKWAEEGYCVVELVSTAWQDGLNPLVLADNALVRCKACQPKGGIGLICESGIWHSSKKSINNAM